MHFTYPSEDIWEKKRSETRELFLECSAEPEFREFLELARKELQTVNVFRNFVARISSRSQDFRQRERNDQTIPKDSSVSLLLRSDHKLDYSGIEVHNTI